MRDEVREELGGVVVGRAGVAEGLKVRQRGGGGAGEDGGASGEQQEVVEELKDAGARLVDGRHDGVAVRRELLESLHHL